MGFTLVEHFIGAMFDVKLNSSDHIQTGSVVSWYVFEMVSVLPTVKNVSLGALEDADGDFVGLHEVLSVASFAIEL